MRRGRQNNRNRPKGPLRDMQGTAMSIPHPPQINPQITHHQRFRFVLSGNQSQKNITFQNLLDMYLVASTAILGYDVFDIVKVKKIEVWALGAGVATPVSVSLTFPGGGTGFAGDARSYQDTSVSEAPAHIVCKPSKFSAAGMWQGSSAFVAFQITAPTQSVVDIEVSMRNTPVAPVAAAVALVGATPGQFYYRGADGQATAGTSWAPQATGPDVI